MKIARIGVYQINVPIGPFTISNGRVTSAFDETIVRVERVAVLNDILRAREGGCFRRS